MRQGGSQFCKAAGVETSQNEIIENALGKQMSYV